MRRVMIQRQVVFSIRSANRNGRQTPHPGPSLLPATWPRGRMSAGNIATSVNAILVIPFYRTCPPSGCRPAKIAPTSGVASSVSRSILET